MFRGINGPFKATRYHSLVVERDTMPDDLAGHRRDRRRPGHGPVAQDAAGAWRAVPSRKHRLRARPSDPEEFSRPRRRLERARSVACIEDASMVDEFKALIAKVATGAALTREEAAHRLRPHDVGRSDALADGRPADGAARARRDRRRDHRRGQRDARQDAQGRRRPPTRSTWSAPAAMPRAPTTSRPARPSSSRAPACRSPSTATARCRRNRARPTC